MTEELHNKLKQKALNIRRDIIEMLYAAGSGHAGGSLSAVEILVYLYECQMKTDPENPSWDNRDRFIASKGHCAPALYAVLAQRGFFDKELLNTLRQLGGMLQGHPDMLKTPGVDLSAGSLGLGLSAGLGFALAAKLDNKDFRTYVLMGDGELNEGQVWEAAMAASKFQADNLIAVIDNNGVQLDGAVSDIMPLGDIGAKFSAFGWNVIKAGGHDFLSLDSAFKSINKADSPSVIIAETIKGKGIDFMENKSEWHGKTIDEASYKIAKAVLYENDT